MICLHYQQDNFIRILVRVRMSASSFCFVTRKRIAYSLRRLRLRLHRQPWMGDIASSWSWEFLAWRSHLLSCLKPTPHGPPVPPMPPPALTPFLPIQSSHFNLGRLEWEGGRRREGGREGNGGNKRRVIQPLQDAPAIM